MNTAPVTRLFNRAKQDIGLPPKRDFIADMMEIEPLVERFDALKTLVEPKDIDKRWARTGPFRDAVQRDVMEAMHEAGNRALQQSSASTTQPTGKQYSHSFLCDQLNRTPVSVDAVYQPIREALKAWRDELQQLSHDIHVRILDMRAFFDSDREAQIINAREVEAFSYLEDRSFLPDYIRREIIDREEREMQYKLLEIRNGGHPPSNFSTGVYLFGLFIVGTLEWILNYFYMESTLSATWPAIAFVLLFGMIMTISSHLCGKIIKERPYYIEFPREKTNRKGEFVIFYFTIACMVIGIIAVSYARYQFFDEQLGVPTLGRGVDASNVPSGAGLGGIAATAGAGMQGTNLGFFSTMLKDMFRGFGSIIASVGFLAAANLFIFCIGSFFSFLHHEKVPGLRNAARIREQASKAVRKLLGFDKDEVEQIRKRFQDMREDLMARTDFIDQSIAKLEAMRRELPDFHTRYGIAKQADRMASEAMQRYREQLRDQLQIMSVTPGTRVAFTVSILQPAADPPATDAQQAAAPQTDATPNSAVMPSGVPSGGDSPTEPRADSQDMDAPQGRWVEKDVDPETYFRLPIRSALQEFKMILTQAWW